MANNTRDEVLKYLLNQPRCTINDIALEVGINPISVRHHIAKLEGDGMVDSEEERHGVGRPRRVYFLTDKGMEQFPSRYLNLSSRLLDQMRDTLPSDTMKEFFANIGADLVKDYSIDELDLRQKVALTKKILIAEGFTVEVEQDEKGFYIRETSCPYVHVSVEHREICLVDETLINTVLSGEAEKTHCILDGDPYCSYFAPTISASDISTLE